MQRQEKVKLIEAQRRKTAREKLAKESAAVVLENRLLAKDIGTFVPWQPQFGE